MLRTVACRLAGCLSSQRPAWPGAAGAARWRSSGDGSSPPSAADEQAARQKEVNKLLYRSRQRGFLELDLLVGLWAEQQVPHMNGAMLAHFAVVLDQENPDLFKWLTGQQAAPLEMQQNPAFMALKQHVAQQLADNSHQASQAAAGKEWLRGWDDSWRQGAPAAAAASSGSPERQPAT